MKKTTIIQGRETTETDIQLVRELIANNPSWNRTRLSRELCRLWNWRDISGRPKDMACRSFLLKLERRDFINLPTRQTTSGFGGRKLLIPDVAHSTDTITGSLRELSPIQFELVADPEKLRLFKCLLSRYHYLGFDRTVGKNLKYLVFDKDYRPLACLLFGSAAWKVVERDRFIGWDAAAKAAKLDFLTNNTRFLILPWVKVPHLASHILSRIARRISTDWMQKYQHPVLLLETFVDCERFRGTCYQAANWIYVGKTTGRSRNDRYSNLKVPVKGCYLYPLVRGFREALR
jgi:hypothetical protein